LCAPAGETVKRLDLAGHGGYGYDASRRAWSDGATHNARSGSLTLRRHRERMITRPTGSSITADLD
jgi:hypothetical protein